MGAWFHCGFLSRPEIGVSYLWVVKWVLFLKLALQMTWVGYLKHRSVLRSLRSFVLDPCPRVIFSIRVEVGYISQFGFLLLRCKWIFDSTNSYVDFGSNWMCMKWAFGVGDFWSGFCVHSEFLARNLDFCFQTIFGAFQYVKLASGFGYFWNGFCFHGVFYFRSEFGFMYPKHFSALKFISFCLCWIRISQ